MMSSGPHVDEANACLARMLARAVDGTAKPRYEIARAARLNKETLLRAIRGGKPIAIGEATRIFGACDVPPKAMIVLALTGHEELAADWMHREIGEFLEVFLLALPGALHEALGAEIGELRSRWAGASARLLAKNLAQHVADLGRRGDAIGELYSSLSANHDIRA